MVHGAPTTPRATGRRATADGRRRTPRDATRANCFPPTRRRRRASRRGADATGCGRTSDVAAVGFGGARARRRRWRIAERCGASIARANAWGIIRTVVRARAREVCWGSVRRLSEGQ